MKTNVSIYDFRDAFLRSEDRKNQFSYQGLTALYEYFEQYEDDCGQEIDFDMIAICCEYTEYESAHEAASNYFDYEGMVFDENGDETMTADEVEESALDYLEYRTQVIKFDGGIIIADF